MCEENFQQVLPDFMLKSLNKLIICFKNFEAINLYNIDYINIALNILAFFMDKVFGRKFYNSLNILTIKFN